MPKLAEPSASQSKLWRASWYSPAACSSSSSSTPSSMCFRFSFLTYWSAVNFDRFFSSRRACSTPISVRRQNTAVLRLSSRVVWVPSSSLSASPSLFCSSAVRGLTSSACFSSICLANSLCTASWRFNDV